MPFKICNHPGCRKMTPERYCPDHAVKRKAQPRTENDRFLDTRAWRKLSRAKLEETPWCEECLRARNIYLPAIAADHILPRHSHPHLALDYANLQSLCASCHSRKTSQGK